MLYIHQQRLADDSYMSCQTTHRASKAKKKHFSCEYILTYHWISLNAHTMNAHFISPNALAPLPRVCSCHATILLSTFFFFIRTLTAIYMLSQFTCVRERRKKNCIPAHLVPLDKLRTLLERFWNLNWIWVNGDRRRWCVTGTLLARLGQILLYGRLECRSCCCC